MRTRLFVISSLAIAAAIGGASANAASAKPQGPGDIKQCQQGCTTTTTAAPKGPDKIAPKPTTTTIPPKGPDDLAPKPPQGDDPKPKGPGDLAQPTDDGVVEPGPDTTGNGSGSDNYVPPASADDTGDETGNGAGNVDVPAVQNGESAAKTTDQESNGVNPFVIILAAAVVGALLALVATRLRGGANTRP
jgi:hypothetical protein